MVCFAIQQPCAAMAKQQQHRQSGYSHSSSSSSGSWSKFGSAQMPRIEHSAETAEIAASTRGAADGPSVGSSVGSGSGGSVSCDRFSVDTDTLALIMRALYHRLRTLRISPI